MITYSQLSVAKRLGSQPLFFVFAVMVYCFLLVWSVSSYANSVERNMVGDTFRVNYQPISVLPGTSAGVAQDIAIEGESRYLSVDHFFTLQETKVRERERRVFFIAKQKDTARFGYQAFNFTPGIEKVTIQRAVVLNPDGSMIALPREAISQRSTNTYETLSPDQEVIVQYFPIEAGSRLLLDIVKEHDLEAMEFGWSFIYALERNQPIDRWSITGSWDEGMDPSITSHLEHIKCDRQKNLMKCETTKPLEYKEVSLDMQEFVGFSQFQAWAEVRNAYNEGFESALSPEDPTLNKVVEDIRKKHPKIEDQIAAVHTIATKKVRYLSRFDKGHFFLPHKSTETYAKRVGDCKDKTTLLVDLLRRLGVDAQPVLVHTERKHIENSSTPSINWFDHLVTCFDFKGQQHCLDATDTQTPWFLTARNIQGKVALGLPKTRELALIDKVPILWKKNVQGRSAFDEEGNFNEYTEIEFETYSGAELLFFYADMDQETIHERQQKVYQENVNEKSEPVVQATAHPDKGTYNIVYKTEYPAIVKPKQALEFPDTHDWYRNELESITPSHDLETAYIDGIEVNGEREYDFGPWQPSVLPINIDFQSEFGSFTRHITKTSDGGLKVALSLRVPSGVYTGKALKLYHAFLRALNRNMEITIRGELI